jgi:heme exporter protein D
MFDELPVWPAYAFSALLLVSLAIGSMLVPRDEVLRGAPDRARWRDIRLWAVALVTVQLGIYWVFS